MFARQLFRPSSSQRIVKKSCSFRYSMMESAINPKIPPSAKIPRSPRVFPSSGFEVINPSQLVEEERLPFYNRDHYYPVRIGEVIKDRYQVVAKLGYGTSSTVWLCRDLREHSHWALKVHVNTMRHNQELDVYQHLARITMEHTGREHVRKLKDSFTLKSCEAEHVVFVMTPLGMSLKDLQDLQKTRRFEQSLVTDALDQVLTGLDFLHEADVVHTDLHPDNILLALTNDSILSMVEDQEICNPSARKQVQDNFIYVSRFMQSGVGPLTICDFGQARIGSEHSGKAMPTEYRAPEVILNMGWGSAVDMWSVGLLAWSLLEYDNLFQVYDRESGQLNDAYHLAAMTALLGPPPLEFLARSKETGKYWHEDGQWKGLVPLPNLKRLESLAMSLEGVDRERFIDFLQCTLCWLPEDRITAGQTYIHPWLRGNTDLLDEVLKQAKH